MRRGLIIIVIMSILILIHICLVFLRSSFARSALMGARKQAWRMLEEVEQERNRRDAAGVELNKLNMQLQREWRPVLWIADFPAALNLSHNYIAHVRMFTGYLLKQLKREFGLCGIEVRRNDRRVRVSVSYHAYNRCDAAGVELMRRGWSGVAASQA